jgi:hypothetical protein
MVGPVGIAPTPVRLKGGYAELLTLRTLKWCPGTESHGLRPRLQRGALLVSYTGHGVLYGGRSRISRVTGGYSSI